MRVRFFSFLFLLVFVQVRMCAENLVFVLALEHFPSTFVWIRMPSATFLSLLVCRLFWHEIHKWTAWRALLYHFLDPYATVHIRCVVCMGMAAIGSV